MKKLLGIVVLGLLLSGNAYAAKVKLICQGLLEKIEGHNFYINFDEICLNAKSYRDMLIHQAKQYRKFEEK